MIDLHIHTIHSDGSCTPREILREAEESGLNCISITDHNSVGAYFDPILRDEPFIGKLIPGIEITCMFEGEVVEVLGYGINIFSMQEELSKHVLSFEQKQLKEYNLISNRFSQIGLLFNKENIQFVPKRESSRKSFLKELNCYPENRRFFSGEDSWQKSKDFARQEIYNPESPLYVDESSLYPSVETAVQMIHRCGGIAFWAHLFVYAHAESFRSRLERLVQQFGLDGMECYHSDFTSDQCSDLDAFCKSHRLLRSGGSDYHGTRKPNTPMGAPQVAEAIIENWPEIMLF